MASAANCRQANSQLLLTPSQAQFVLQAGSISTGSANYAVTGTTGVVLDDLALPAGDYIRFVTSTLTAGFTLDGMTAYIDGTVRTLWKQYRADYDHSCQCFWIYEQLIGLL